MSNRTKGFLRLVCIAEGSTFYINEPTFSEFTSYFLYPVSNFMECKNEIYKNSDGLVL
jgi:hypothetical protein